jgi:dihydroorotase
MTEATTPEMVVAGYDQPSDMQAFKCMKMFVRAASNASGADVDDMRRVVPVLKAMSNTNWKYQRKPMVLKVHCERKYTLQGGRISIFDRERVAVERDINYLLSEVPEATIEICHVSDGSTIEAIRHFRSKGFRVHGEIAPHYTQYTIDDLFEGADGGTQLNAHRFCLPVFKSDKDRQILLDAMVSGDPAFHFGDDEACHVDVEHIYANPPKGTPARGYKISKGGYVLGGQTQIPEAVVSYVIEQFADRGQLDHLPDFMSGNARKLYDLPEAQEMTYWHPEAWIVPHVMSADLEGTGRQLARMLSCKVAMGGQTRHYRPLL